MTVNLVICREEQSIGFVRRYVLTHNGLSIAHSAVRR